MPKYAIQSRVTLNCQKCAEAFEAKRRDTKWCAPCAKAVKLEQSYQSHARHRERRNDDQRKRVLQWSPERKQQHQEGQRNRLLKRNYGLTRAQYDQMVKEQDGCCAICRDFVEVPFVDHDHDTKQVRGLLCTNCNFGIGSLQDSPELLQRAIEYLKRSAALADIAEA